MSVSRARADAAVSPSTPASSLFQKQRKNATPTIQAAVGVTIPHRIEARDFVIAPRFVFDPAAQNRSMKGSSENVIQKLIPSLHAP
jgi:hypothetical protein